MKGLQQLMEARLADVKGQRAKLMDGWSPYIKAVESYKAKRGESLSEWDKFNIARCLENAVLESGLRQQSRIFETTYMSNISFLGIQLPVIAALIPSLCLNKLAIVQALDRRQGAAFYLDVQYGRNKGGITAGQTMMSSKTGHNSTQAGREYASQRVYGEVLSTTSGTSKSGNLVYLPVTVGSVIITNGVETFTDNGTGGLVSNLSGGNTGTINYTTGAYAVTFLTSNVSGVAVTAQYKYVYDAATAPSPDGVPEVNINLTNAPVTAEDFPLKAIYTLGAAIDLEKAHGLNLEDEVIKYLGGEIKFTMDHLGIDQINAAAASSSGAAAPTQFSVTPVNSQEYIFKRLQYIDQVEQANVNIIAATLRAMCTFIICGNNVGRLIRQLGDHFKPAADLGSLTPTGPFELGTLDGRLVIQDPFMPVNSVTYGHRGENFLMGGFLFAPYIPLMMTPTILLGNLQAQKGFLASAGYLTLNAGFFSAGTITGY